MNSTTRALSTLAVTALGAGFALAAAAAPASAQPRTAMGSGEAECSALSGTYAGPQDGGSSWTCHYVPAPGASPVGDPTLTTACTSPGLVTVYHRADGSYELDCNVPD
jgi:hypothetical protein